MLQLSDIERRLGDRYTIERELGHGGMGAVYLARDLKLDRAVALKVLPPEFAGDAALRERFLRETRTAASFSHPNIVPVHAVEDREGVLAFAMGYVEGDSLADRVKRAGPLDVRGMVKLLQDIGYALAYAHGRGVVHRDIKPDNIMLERATGRAMLMDFGIARTAATKVESQGLTRVGEVVGTPEYMSPEQASGDVVDGRSDLYSLGLVALFALTGRAIMSAPTAQQMLVKQLTEAPPGAAALRGDLPAALANAIDRCVAKDPQARFASAEELVETIDDAQLAAPEIPLPVRLFAQEAGTLGLIITFLVLMFFFLAPAMSTGGAFDAVIPMVLLGAIGFTRVLQLSSAARRLALLGFGATDVLKGMRATVDERESVRVHLRTDADTVRRRRITLRMASVMLPVAVVMVLFALAGRVEVAPNQFSVTTGALVMLVSGVVMIGTSLMLFARSPFRAPLGERLFRGVWLGGAGRAFLRFSMRGVERASSAAPTGAAAAVAGAHAAAPGDALARLEARVRDLERTLGR